MENWLKNSIGRSLKSVSASIYQNGNAKDYLNPSQINIDFGCFPVGYIACAADGFSIEWTEEPLEEFDMGDAGRRIVEDISARNVWQKVIGQTLERALVYMEDTQSKPVGIGLIFESGDAFVVNLGDELYIYDRYPESSFEGEKIRIKTFAQT